MKILKRVLVLSVAALVTYGAFSANAQAAQRRGGYSAGAGHQGQNRAHRAPITRGYKRGGRDSYRGGRHSYRGGGGFYRGGRGAYRGGRGHYRGGRGTFLSGRGSYRGGRGYYRGGPRVRHYAKRPRFYYPGYAPCRPTYSFFYDSYGNRIQLHGSSCF
jgi:hypothetical protein